MSTAAKRPKAVGRIDFIGQYHRKLAAVEATKNEERRLKRGMELLTDVLQVLDDLEVVCIEVKAALGLKTSRE